MKDIRFPCVRPIRGALALGTTVFGLVSGLERLVWAGGEAKYAQPTLLCRYTDPQVAEASGIAASSRSDDYFFVHNDSGDGPFVYAVNRAGDTLCKFTVSGATAEDWEDMALGPGVDGKKSLYLADIGDNARNRQRISIYRIPEPKPDSRKTGSVAETPPAERFDLQYEDGPRDAETLLVHPKTGQVFIVSKSREGSTVYAAPQPLRTDTTNVLHKAATIRFNQFPATDGSKRDEVGALLATGGAIAPDGKRLVVRTYTDAREWPLVDGDVAAAFSRDPQSCIGMPALRGGEAITYTRDGRSLLITNEGKNAAVFQIRGTR